MTGRAILGVVTDLGELIAIASVGFLPPAFRRIEDRRHEHAIESSARWAR